MSEHASLKKASARLRRLGVIPAASASLTRTLKQTLGKLRRALERESAPSADIEGDSAIAPVQHLEAHLQTIQRLWSGQPVDFNFVAGFARDCAAQRFALNDLLHVYRTIHSVLAAWLRAAVPKPERTSSTAIAADDFTIAYLNSVSALATTEYLRHAEHLTQIAHDNDSDLFNALLKGHDENDSRVTTLLRAAGYFDPRQHFCAAAIRAAAPTEMQNAARVQRIVDAVKVAIGPAKIATLVGVHDNLVVAIFSDLRRQSGWTAPRPSLTSRLHQYLLNLGPAVLVGIGDEQTDVLSIRKSIHEATVALDCAHVAERVVFFGNLSLRSLLLRHGRDHLKVSAPAWVARFIEADNKMRHTLSSTLRAYAAADMNMLQAARSLSVHANTLYARMNRIKALTGINCQHYHGLTELLLAADGQAR